MYCLLRNFCLRFDGLITDFKPGQLPCQSAVLQLRTSGVNMGQYFDCHHDYKSVVPIWVNWSIVIYSDGHFSPVVMEH